ncbi:MAG: Uric acid degradation bifunctional protein [Verrucomicrobiae bacterium]|nr:Uric acid degradation bifunctional protein [Verrucomicrobiae bacterium]
MQLAQLNALSQADFIRIVGPVFEHSPWIAEATWLKRPFRDVAYLHQLLCDTVSASREMDQLELIKAHPDLVTRMKLTAESQREQASAGLTTLTTSEIAIFETANQQYREKFGFPFVICARLNNKDTILAGFRTRLHNTRDAEIKIALEEIYKIAKLRLDDLCPAN